MLSGEALPFAEVLMIATPCPLLIAAPVAFLGGMSRTARNGIIAQNCGPLEQLARIRTAVFVKTGTLPHGHPTLEQIWRSGVPGTAFSDGQLLALAASVELHSSYVLAASALPAAGARQLDIPLPSEAVEHATDGVAVLVDGYHGLVGKQAFVELPTGPIEEAVAASGQPAVYVAIDKVRAVALIMRNALRGNAVLTWPLWVQWACPAP